jgi:hypothetical protein
VVVSAGVQNCAKAFRGSAKIQNTSAQKGRSTRIDKGYVNGYVDDQTTTVTVSVIERRTLTERQPLEAKYVEVCVPVEKVFAPKLVLRGF